MEKISVIVPIYKAEKFIERTVRSVISQTYTHWELILVIDGSPMIRWLFAGKWQNKIGVSSWWSKKIAVLTGQD
ncbi:glycosyltransferase [Bacteroides sp. AM51-7]|nr:glycosyltransferase [Bacteroides sp. AM51-7]